VPIRILPEEVASAIAAGEVIERPASVVKELVENALDAGAKRILIRVQGGGQEMVEVADDGCGIPAEEVPLAFARYATSKLQTADDLQAISTLGFRGEALASISAVSRMEIITRAKGEASGTRLVVEGGKIDHPTAHGTAEGTTVRVRDLFYNVPARKEFLKSAATERRWISRLVTRYALAYPSVAFHLEMEGRPAFRSSGKGDRREVLMEVFGLEVGKAMLALPAAPAGRVGVEGFISPPSVHRGNRREITLFVNGRWVQDASLSAAVLQAYHTLLMVGRYPIVVLFIQIEPSAVDVNIHPTKAEVRFREPQAIFAVLQRAVRATLVGQSPAPALDIGARWQSLGPTLASRELWRGSAWEAASDEPGVLTDLQRQPALPGGSIPLLRAVGQVGAAYLVAEGPDGLYLVDQHAAHERVLFERMMAQERERGLESQALLQPETLELPPHQAPVLVESLQALRKLGFDIEPFGERAFIIRAIPAMLGKLPPRELVQAVVEEVEEDETPLAGEAESRLAARVCKRAAIKSGQVLSLAEQEALLRDLESCLSPRTCPHGRPTMIHLSVETLERQFRRR